VIKKDYDAIIVGSGPNGLSAAITLQREGLSVLLLEAKSTIGGGMRTEELTLPGFKHDICSAIHPMAADSGFFQSLPLHDFGLEYITPPVAFAHPLDNGTAGAAFNSLDETALALGEDGKAYKNLLEPVIRDWRYLEPDLLSPLHFPSHFFTLARFGSNAIRSANAIAKRFKSEKAKALWAGVAAHSALPLNYTATAAIGMVLGSAAHRGGWPMAKGGSQSIARSLAGYFVSLGGKIETGIYVKSLQQLPSCYAVLFDVSPQQLLQISDNYFSETYKRKLIRYKYGMGVFKIDWALDAPIPFTASECRLAGTVHIGNTLKEISASERSAWEGKEAETPFVLLAQQSLFDDTRAPQGKHTAWAYCHVPNGSQKDMTEAIEKQVERFAPGFRERIIGRHTMNTRQMEEYNPNYIGGDIVGGANTIRQLFARPVLKYSPYRTSSKGIYICSASTPPGGGVHGFCGFHAARRVLSDIFSKRQIPVL
jgi:phytoene dehydrogenase-like protein